MKKVIFTVFALVLFSTFAVAQWEYVKDFALGTSPHGIAVDHDGKIWIGYYGVSDTLFTDDGDTIKINALRCYNQDGSQADFSPIMIFSDGGDIQDTLNYVTKPFSCRGVSVDHNGNILYIGSGGWMWRINSQTGEALGRFRSPAQKSMTQAAVDENGYIYITSVVPAGTPFYILDEDFELYSFVVDSNFTISRGLAVSPDGKDVYLGRIYGGATGNGIIHYHSDDGPDGEYVVVDTLLKNIWAGSCLDWDPWGMLWAGSYWDVAASELKGWYQIDINKGFMLVDSIGTPGGKPAEGPKPPLDGNFYSPRHIAFYEDGGMWYALTNDFDGAVTKQFKNANPYTGIITIDNGVVVRNFSLLQNYPNPFNPTTTIPFELGENAFVELKVFDVTGSVVKTLISQKMMAGSYEIPFNASDFATGTYFYRLFIDGKVQTKSMTLVK